MIGLRVNGTWLDLDPGLSLNLTMLNPAFDLDSIERLFSFPFAIQLTDTNAGAFRHAQRLDTTDANRLYDAELYLGGILFDPGVLRITGRTQDAIEAAFQNGQLDWLQRLRNTRLRDLAMPVTVPGADYVPVLRFYYAESTDPEEFLRGYLIEINGVLYEGTSGPSLVSEINADYPDFATDEPEVGSDDAFFLLLDTAEVTLPLGINLAPDSPGLPGYEYFFPAYAPDESRLAETAVRDAWIDHFAAVLADPDDHVFPVVRADALYDGKNAAWENYMNYTDTDGEHPGNEVDMVELGPTEGYLDRGWQHTAVPMPFLKDVLSKLFGVVGAASLEGNFATDEDLQQLIVFNNRTLDALYHPRYLFAAGNTTAWGWIFPPYNGYASEYNLAEHLPDMSCYDYLIALSSMFALTYSIRAGAASVRTIDSQLSQPPEDWTHRMEPEYSAEVEQYDGYELDYERQGADDVVAGQLEALNEPGESVWAHKSAIFSLYHQEFQDGERAWQVPFWEGKGSSPALRTSEPCPVMLLFWLGLQNDDDGNPYPMASHHNRNFAGTRLGEYSLNWQGDDGLFNRFWEKYVSVLSQGVPCRRVARMTVSDLMRWRENPCRPIHIYSPHGAATGIVRSINTRINMTTQEYFLCELEMLLIT